jgi:hypothetical protein
MRVPLPPGERDDAFPHGIIVGAQGAADDDKRAFRRYRFFISSMTGATRQQCQRDYGMDDESEHRASSDEPSA